MAADLRIPACSKRPLSKVASAYSFSGQLSQLQMGYTNTPYLRRFMMLFVR
jgi:hypothetical protein